MEGTFNYIYIEITVYSSIEVERTFRRVVVGVYGMGVIL